MNITRHPFPYQNEMLQQHRRWLQEYGLTEKALGWGSAEGMEARFLAACEVMRLTEYWSFHGMSVLDVGCGFGDLLPFVEKMFVWKYFGIDVVPEFIAEARKRYEEREAQKGVFAFRPKVGFRLNDCFSIDGESVWDVVMALGVAWMEGGKEFLRLLMRKCHRLCKVAAVVSVTSERTLGEKEGFNLVRPGEFADMAGQIAERFVLRHDYWGTDMMVYLYKEPFRRF